MIKIIPNSSIWNFSLYVSMFHQNLFPQFYWLRINLFFFFSFFLIFIVMWCLETRVFRPSLLLCQWIPRIFMLLTDDIWGYGFRCQFPALFGQSLYLYLRNMRNFDPLENLTCDVLVTVDQSTLPWNTSLLHVAIHQRMESHLWCLQQSHLWNWSLKKKRKYLNVLKFIQTM